MKEDNEIDRTILQLAEQLRESAQNLPNTNAIVEPD